MNSAPLNGNTLNTRGQRGVLLRVAADLLGTAFVTARAMVFRRVDSAVNCSAAIGPRVGWRGVRDSLSVSAAAEVALEALPRLRDSFSNTCSAAIALSASAGRRAVVALAASAQISLTAYALLRGAANFQGSANLPSNLKSWRRSPGAVAARASVAVKAGVLNDFPYDEDAPEDRVFVVAPEDNIFYVVV